MDFINGLLEYAVPFLGVLTVLVFVHEMGHYSVARYFGVRVEIFSIGFGREVFGWHDKAGTRWKVSLIPLGGYVKMFGDANAASMPDDRASEMTPEERAVAFPCKPLGQRALIVAAGPVANFLFAMVALAGLFMFVGQPFTPAVVTSVLEDSAAERAGFAAGDRIVDIDGTTIERFEDIVRIVRLAPSRHLTVSVERDGQIIVLDAIPEREVSVDALGNEAEIGKLGISTDGTAVEYIRFGPAEALWRGVAETGDLSVRTLQVVGEIVTGNRSASELGGPIKIAEMSGQVAAIGFVSLVWFSALLSVNLGLINLFPVPMLDGGHLLFYGIEALRGRPLGERAQEYGFRIGLALVLCLFVFVTWNDIVGIYQRL